MLFYPKMYKKNVREIDYDKLKQHGIKCLIYDLDNTLALIDEEIVDDSLKSFLCQLKDNFIIVIISNNKLKRVKKYADSLECDFVSFACKPLARGFRKIQKKYGLMRSEMAMIGDQLVTDIFGANAYGIYAILVDPMAEEDLKITGFNRKIEKCILNEYSKKKIMKKGEYYD